MKCIHFYILFLFPALIFSQLKNISGTIADEKSGETLVGITVSLYSAKDNKLLTGAYTNKFGFFSIPKVEKGNYVLVISGVGYETGKKNITLAESDQMLNIKLKPVDIRMQEVTIEKEKYNLQTHNISSIDIRPEFVNKMPSLGGETDVFRTLQLLPGVKQSTELSSGLYVRGGSPDQNLTLLDGVIVYNPGHLGGFLSTFNSDALKDIKLIKGGFPAEYGGRISSVLDMTMREGTAEKITGAGGISLINSRLTVEGPINENSTFMISGRRMYLDLLLSAAPNSDEMPDYYFYDLNAKINYKISEKDRVFISGFFGRDVLAGPVEKSESMNVNWGNTTANLRWMHIISADLFTNFSLIHTNYQFNTEFYDETNSSQDFYSQSKVQDYLLRADMQYFPTQNHTFKSGFEIIWHDFIANASFDLINGPNKNNSPESEKISSLESSIYFQDEWKINELFNMNLGGRLFYFQKGNYFNFEPRLNASYILNDNTSLKGSFSLANQFLHMIIRNDITLPTDLWFPSTDKLKPSKAWQATLGIETSFLNGEYFLSGEVYYKKMSDLLEYKDSVSFSLGIPLEDYFTSGNGEAYGFEIFLNKRIGSFTGWLGYTLSWTKRKFPDINEGREFYPRYDRRHDISLVLTYNLSESWELGLSWVYGTGQAYTVPAGKYFTQGVSPAMAFNEFSAYNYYAARAGYYFSEKNSYRLPAFHKMDLNFMHKFFWFGLPFQLSLNVYNAYNHANPFFWLLETEDQPGGKSKTVIKQYTIFPIIPTLGLSFKF